MVSGVVQELGVFHFVPTVLAAVLVLVLHRGKHRGILLPVLHSAGQPL